jgi:hypothetical protein
MTAFEIVTQALKDRGVSQEEIDNLSPEVPQVGDSSPEDQKFLARARLLVARNKARAAGERTALAASDPPVGCKYTEGGRTCTINIDLITWETIKAKVDPNATKGPPVPPSQEGWVPAKR